MAAAQILYVLKMGGDLAQKLPALSASLDKVKEKALAAKAAAASLGARGREGLNSLAEGAGTAAEGFGVAGAAIGGLALGVHALIADQKDYEQATTRLIIQLRKMRDGIAEAIGPTVGKYVDSFTIGLVYIFNLISGSIAPAFELLGRLVGVVANRISASMQAWKKILSGDFSGAADILKGHKEAWGEVVKATQDGFAKLDAARDNAFNAAFDAWKKQVDGIKDVVDEIRVVYEDIVSTISGLRGPAGEISGLYNTTAPIPMGTVQNSGLPGPVQVSQAEVAAAIEGQTTRLGGVLEKVGTATEAVGGGVSGVLEMIPIYGGFLSGIWELLSNFGGITESIVNEVLGFFDGLGEQFRTVIIDLPLKIIEDLPDIAATIIGLIPRIILQMVASAPLIFAEIIEAIFELPVQIGREFAAMFQQFWLDIKEAFGKIGDLFTGKEGKFLGTSIAGKENKGNRSIFGINLPSFDNGGRVTRTGLAMVHAGETYSGVGRGRQSQGGGTNIITINVQGQQDPDRFVREIAKRLGPYGVGLHLKPQGT